MMVKAAKFSALMVFIVALCLSAPLAQADGFAGRAKIATPNILDDLSAGKETVKVIVMLAGQGANNTLLETQGRSSLASIRSRVVKVQNKVIGQVSASEVIVRHKFENINAFSAEVTEKGLKQLAAIGAVVQIEDDFKVEAKTRQGIPQMGGSPYWNSGVHTGSGIAVAVMDTGITRYHTAFTQGGWNKVLGGWNFSNNTSDFSDSNGHGTACAGIIAGFAFDNGDYMGGVAPGAALYGLKVLGDDGSGDFSWTVAAIDWAVSHQWDNANYPIMVLSASLGGGISWSACDDQMSAMAAAGQRGQGGRDDLLCRLGQRRLLRRHGRPGLRQRARFRSARSGTTPAACARIALTDNSCLGSYNAGCLPYGLTRLLRAVRRLRLGDSVLQLGVLPGHPGSERMRDHFQLRRRLAHLLQRHLGGYALRGRRGGRAPGQGPGRDRGLPDPGPTPDPDEGLRRLHHRPQIRIHHPSDQPEAVHRNGRRRRLQRLADSPAHRRRHLLGHCQRHLVHQLLLTSVSAARSTARPRAPGPMVRVRPPGKATKIPTPAT